MKSVVPTQKSIANKLGISQAVVSKVLSGNTSRVSRETAEQILEAAKQLNYNKRKQSQSRFIGLLLSEAKPENDRYSYTFRLLSGIQEQARKLNAIPIQRILNAGSEAEAFQVDVSGWISMATLTPERLRMARRPLIALHGVQAFPEIDSVAEDTSMGVKSAINALHGMGHRHFGYFNVRPWGVTQAENYGAFHQALSELDLPNPPPEWIFTPRRRESSMADVEHQLRDMLSELKTMKTRPSALFIAGDIYAIPFLRLAPEYGFSIPKDFSVFSYDDIPDAASSVPPLSSIAQPLEALGREAVSRLMTRIDNPGMPARTIRVPMEFKNRASVGPANA